MYKTKSCIRTETGSFTKGQHEVVEEFPLSVSLNGRNILTAMVSPGAIEDFVTGFLFTEQIIEGAHEIESLMVEKERVSVLTKNPFRPVGAKKLVLSGCGGGSSFMDAKKLPRITSEQVFSPNDITAAMKDLTDSALHKLTGGVHVVGLLQEGRLVHRAEDIGRHNAMDKVIGHALKNAIDLSHTAAISSGRISSEMVRKCLVANIPVIASRGATTSLAVDVAAKNGLCIIGFVRGSKMNIYTHPERITGSAACLS
ncbi:MAG: formate dehydrogenase accessory sulfurtransferase FdhD [Methanomicrobiales archaeon]|nr:formate dehydrogenase accessory sulfurtransferase FdhD [Methanomicrobiales archaeon]